MSNEELVGAYIDGAISRRTLIRRLIAGGVSIGAATAYAHHLAPTASARGSGPFEYPVVRLRILSDDLRKVIQDEKLEVRVRSTDPCRLDLILTTRQGQNQVQLGKRRVRFTEGGRKNIKVRIDRVGPLRGRERVRVKLTAISDEGPYQPRVATVTKRLER